MINQTAIIVNILTHKNAVKVATCSVAVLPKKSEINSLPLRTVLIKKHVAEKSTLAWLNMTLVLLAHGLLIYWLATQKPLKKIQYQRAKPILVSIVAPPSPEPKIVPIVDAPKPEPKPILKPKKVLEKIKPIDKPVERLVEATAELIKEEQIVKPEASHIMVNEPAKAPKATPVIEDKYEEPRFGVSYLNNPAPDYPSMSRRQGEEGRVLMSVLVSAEGMAEEVQIEKSSGSDRLDNAAMTAVKRWRFIPAKKNNQPISAYVLVPIKFSLDN